MTYLKFLAYNIAGGILWICSITLAGYYFGNIPVVKNNFTIVIIAIVFISVLPGVIEYLRNKRQARGAGNL
jgi:membrane-associated protein